MRARLWGVRGSIPVPGARTAGYGGNTSCVEVRLEGGEHVGQSAGQRDQVGIADRLTVRCRDGCLRWIGDRAFQLIEQVLVHLGIRELFDAIVTSEDVARQKPAPDIFLEAARRIGVPPQNCRAYEDTDLGMQAIRSAGMEAIDVRQLLAPAVVSETQTL